MERAISTGFYLEALVLCDSLITDRIRVISAYSANSPVEIRGVNNGLLNLGRAGVVLLDAGLVEETRTWGRHRNAAVHGFSKLTDFEGDSWHRRLMQARAQAQVGLLLSKRWLAETKRHRI